MIVGYLLVHFSLIDYLRNYKLIGWMTIIFGILLYFSDLRQKTKSINVNYNLKNAIYIGFFQILSLIPGVRRSVITITGARFLNFNRIDSVTISFLMSIPTLVAVSSFNLTTVLVEDNLSFYVSRLSCIGFSYLFFYFTIKLFFNFFKNYSFYYFVIYSGCFGFLILFYAYFLCD